jgi:hypothetical protein
VDVRPTLEGPLVFVTADRGLEGAARAHGFATMNPLRDGVAALKRILQP